MVSRKLFSEDAHALSAVYMKQVSGTLVIKILSVLISILYVPVVLGYLDQEKYGIWITITTIVNWIRLLDVGMGNGMRNKLSEAVVLNKPGTGKELVSTTFGLLGGIFLFALLIFYLVNPYIDWQNILNSTLIPSSELIQLTNIVVSLIVLGFILQPVTLVFAAYGNSVAGGVIQLVISSLSLILIWLVSIYTDKGNIILLAWILTGTPVLVYIVAALYTFIVKYPHLRPSLRSVKIKDSGSLMRLSGQFFIVQMTATIIFSSVPFVIAQLFGPNEVTVFNIANSIFNLPIMVITLITAPVLPLVTQAFARQDYHWIKSMLRRMNMVSVILVAGTVLMILVSPFIYKIWIGDKADIPFNLSLVIGIYAIINVFNTPYSIFINGIGKIRLLVILAPVFILTFIGFSIILANLLNDVISVPIALSIISLIGLISISYEIKKYIAPGLKNSA